MFLISRSWLRFIAEDYGAHLALNTEDRKRAALAAQEKALDLLNLAPWHFRILVGGVECLASLLCRLCPVTQAQQIKIFERIPVISPPLLRLYRSLVAISWFEQPETLKAYNIQETPQDHQNRFRSLRRKLS